MPSCIKIFISSIIGSYRLNNLSYLNLVSLLFSKITFIWLTSGIAKMLYRDLKQFCSEVRLRIGVKLLNLNSTHWNIYHINLRILCLLFVFFPHNQRYEREVLRKCERNSFVIRKLPYWMLPIHPSHSPLICNKSLWKAQLAQAAIFILLSQIVMDNWQ